MEGMIELSDLVGGALQEQFQRAFEKVIENLQNPNTPYRLNREINIKLKFAQNEKRDDVKCAILVSEKLAPQSPMETGFSVGKDLRSGKLYTVEYGKGIRGQMSIDDVSLNDGEELDTETGEILSEPNTEKVIDLRKAK